MIFRIINRLKKRSERRSEREKLLKVYRKFKDFTMIPQGAYCENLILLDKVCHIPGAIVECGTWKGGMIAGIASLLGDEKEYWLFDSFEGLPPAKEIDGAGAIQWQADKESPNFHDNCSASEESAHRAMILSEVSNVSIVKGWFNDTLPLVSITGGIAVLRMDADWYDSTMEILNSLFHQVNTGGLIIIDDYYAWDGCSRAVHEFLARNTRAERIHTSAGGVCYIQKMSSKL